MIFAPAIGPTLSGWIIQNYEWPMLFFMIAPIAFIILLIAVFRLHDKKESLLVVLISYRLSSQHLDSEVFYTASVQQVIKVGAMRLLLHL